jgi:hypothetical protein
MELDGSLVGLQQFLQPVEPLAAPWIVSVADEDLKLVLVRFFQTNRSG